MNMSVFVFWVVKPRGFVDTFRINIRTPYSALKTEAVRFSETLVSVDSHDVTIYKTNHRQLD